MQFVIENCEKTDWRKIAHEHIKKVTQMQKQQNMFMKDPHDFVR